MQASQGELGYRDLLWLLGSLCNLYRIPFDPKLIEQDFPPPHDLNTFHEAARALGFKTGHSAHPADWQKLPLPAIAFLRAVPEALSTEPLPSIPVLILKTDGHKLLYFRAGSQTPETLTVDEAATQFAPELILVARETAGTGKNETIPGFDAEQKAFGFRWFIPELLKHRAIWRDVLLASLAIQLVGLATPLFTQVIIDKVVVHQTHSTLIVLGIALLIFMIFTAGMSWLRQYLVLHTGNRIDAVLGSQVFPAPPAAAAALFRAPSHWHSGRPAARCRNHPRIRLRRRRHADPRPALPAHLPGRDVCL